MNDETTPATDSLPLPDPSTLLFGGVATIALLQSLRIQQTAGQELADLLSSWVPPKPQPPLEAPPPARAPVRPWGVTERPKRITWDFCFRLKWRTWPIDQKRIVPSASSRSQYTRIGTVIGPLWGEKLDEIGASFEKLRWIAAPEDAFERDLRYQRVIRGEKVDLRHTEPAGPPPLDEELVRIAEEELSRSAGRTIRVPRKSLEAVAAEPPPKEQKKRGRPRVRQR
jgi:hypothetical protein